MKLLGYLLVIVALAAFAKVDGAPASPCGCQTIDFRVCATNGRFYANACLFYCEKANNPGELINILICDKRIGSSTIGL